MATTLVITNDFPPTVGGIEAFIAQLCDLLGDVVVLTRTHPGATTADHARPYPIHRQGRLLLPTAHTLRSAKELLSRHRATRVIFGAAAPLGLLAPGLRAAGASHMLAITHGHETWWATLPGTRQALRRIGDHVTAVSTISTFTHQMIAPALSPAAQTAMVRLAPPVDTHRFVPTAQPHGSATPTVVAAGRFIAQKGFDVLLTAWALVVAAWPQDRPEPRLLLIGDGPETPRLQAQASALPRRDTVTFTGPVSHEQMPHHLARGQVFALPVRTRWGGLNPEGLGLVFAEAAACGLAVVAGDSGGTRDTLIPGVTGVLTSPDDPPALAGTLIDLLSDLPKTQAMGLAGRRHVQRNFSPTTTAAVVRQVLDLG